MNEMRMLYVTNMKDDYMLNSLKDKVSGFMGSGGSNQFKDITFPTTKENLLVQLEKRGVPGAVVNKIRKVDTAQYDSLEDLKKKTGL
jgi:hypothetical protein